MHTDIWYSYSTHACCELYDNVKASTGTLYKLKLLLKISPNCKETWAFRKVKLLGK